MEYEPIPLSKEEINQQVNERNRLLNLQRENDLNDILPELYSADNEQLAVQKQTLHAKLDQLSLTDRQTAAEQYEGKVGSAYEKISHGKTLSKSDRSKRAKKAQKKAGLQASLLVHATAYLDLRDKMAEQKIKEITLTGSNWGLKINTFVKDNPYSELIKDWAALGELEHGNMKTIISRMTRLDTGFAANEMRKELYFTDLSEFEYKTDQEFVHGFQKKYAKLRAFAHLEEMEELPVTDRGYYPGKMDKLELHAKIRIVKQLKEDYEARMLLIQSPYYLLLAGKDTLQVSDKKWDTWMRNTENIQNEPALQEYMKVIDKQRKQKTVRKGCNINELLKKEIPKVQKEYYEKDLARYDEKMSDIKAFAEKDGNEEHAILSKDPYKDFPNDEETLEKYIHSLTAYYLEKGKAKAPHVTREKFGKESPAISGDLLEGLTIDDMVHLQDLNEKFLHDEEFRKEIGGEYDDSFLEQLDKMQEEWVTIQNTLNDYSVALQLEAYDESSHTFDAEFNPLCSKDQKAMMDAFRLRASMCISHMSTEYEQAKAAFTKINKDIMVERLKRGIFYSKGEKPWEYIQEQEKKADFLPDKDMVDSLYNREWNSGREITDEWKKKEDEHLRRHSLKVGDAEFPIMPYTASTYKLTLPDGSNFDLRSILLNDQKLQLKPGVTMEELNEAYNELVPAMKKYRALANYFMFKRPLVNGIVNAETLEYKNYFEDSVYYPALKKFASLLENPAKA